MKFFIHVMKQVYSFTPSITQLKTITLPGYDIIRPMKVCEGMNSCATGSPYFHLHDACIVQGRERNTFLCDLTRSSCISVP